MKLPLQALEFAAECHRGQRRKDADGSPYINHPIAVASLLAGTGGVTDQIVIAAGFLHDVVEDAGVTPRELEARFGAEVREVVTEVSDDKSLAKEVRKRLQIEHAPRLSRRAKLVKLADKIANVRDVIEHPPVTWSRRRRQEYLEWSAEVVEGCRGNNQALEMLFDELLARGKAALFRG
jgi:guanosine-3',5'-bis(diphosphate) 3'-pyrophosphohydrolase